MVSGFLVSFSVTDYTSSVLCKAFLRYRKDSGFRRSSEDQVPITEEERKAVQDKVDRIQVGVNVRLRGECSWDTFSRELTIRVLDMVPMEKIRREDARTKGAVKELADLIGLTDVVRMEAYDISNISYT